ncbi:MAG: ribosome small subunit-dependent GTPase A [Saprospiraceae bacterium]|nr:ribosome small subunit-dependent GTPase A [Saprospiraceae bacterium]
MAEIGLVVKSTGLWYEVETNTFDRYKCRIIGKFRLQGIKLTNPVAVGDKVDFEIEDNEEKSGIIKKIHSRKNYIVRQSPRKKHFLHLLASNVDQAILIVTITFPNLKQGFIDRFLLMTEPYNIPVIIVFNKSDLYQEEEMNIYNTFKECYEKISYKCILTSALTGNGIEELNQLFKDKTSLIAGQSGVGKSTLINAIQPELELKTKEISDYSGKGQHTTTFAELYRIENRGNIIDTPGIKGLSFNNLNVLDVAHNFREFFELSKECKFSNCTHRNEPKCAVKNELDVGGISEMRYLNYLQILDEIESQNHWDIHEM